MNKKTIINLACGICALAGIAISLASSYFADQKLDMTIDEKVSEALAKLTNGES